ncbi:MAG: hypothetical protein D6734_02045 [Candidatus Schekmanbacteria bacterium]|nr:MAG: hypothetical protein D6734_02045 [Candidatus Schekmanbacteria bacterium]
MKVSGKLLLHTCCGPCVIYPLQVLEKKYEITAFFYNPNIFPKSEYLKRQVTMENYLEDKKIPILFAQPRETYDDFLKSVEGNEDRRCEICYHIRLETTARRAIEEGFDKISSTLLYSIYMKHKKLKEIAVDIANRYKIDFVYEDFRKGWKIGVQESLKIGMYRQKYCGCSFSLEERNQRIMEKERKKRGVKQ